MPAQGESFLVNVAFWSGDPTGVATAAFNPPQGSLVFDLAGGPPRIKNSTDNSSYGTVPVNGGNITPSGITASGAIVSTSPTAGVGYATGAGGSVTQLTNKGTGVTLNKVCGAITLNNAALTTLTAVKFTLTNSAISLGDVVVVNHSSAGTDGAYLVGVSAIGAGSADIVVFNTTGGTLSEAIVLSFAVVNGVTA